MKLPLMLPLLPMLPAAKNMRDEAIQIVRPAVGACHFAISKSSLPCLLSRMRSFGWR